MTDHDQAMIELVNRWFTEVWNQGRSEAMDEILAPGCIVYGINDAQGNPLQGPAGFRPFHQVLRGALPDIHITVEDCVVSGDKIAVRCHVTATHQGDTLGIAATQNKVEFTGMAIVRVEGGMIVEAWNNFDFLTMYQQVGMLPTL